MNAVYKKELRSYFSGMTGYIAISLILVITGIFVKLANLDSRYPSMESILPNVTLILLIAVPIVTMRSFAEERNLKTDILLYTLPIKTSSVVMGKYLAIITVFAVPCGIMMLYPIILSIYGTVNFLATAASVIAFYLLCCAMSAICMFMSSLTESQVIAAILGVASLVVCYISTLIAEAIPQTATASFIAFTVLIAAASLGIYCFVKNYWVALASGTLLEAVAIVFYLRNESIYTGLFQKTVGALSIFEKYNAFVMNQLVDMTVLVYYISIIFFFCFLTVQTVEKRRYS